MLVNKKLYNERKQSLYETKLRVCDSIANVTRLYCENRPAAIER
jgi:hypothetical protein